MSTYKAGNTSADTGTTPRQSRIAGLFAWGRKSRERQKSPLRLRWTPELVDRFWTGISQTRLTELNFARLGGKRLIAAIAHLLPKDGRILDFGAGDGELIELLCSRGLRVAGYEPSRGRAENLQKALAHVPEFQGAMPPSSDATFDLVLMVEVIEHIIDEQLNSTLKTVAAHTRVGGILIVSTPNNEDLELNMAYCPVSNTLFHRWQHVRSFTKESLTELLAQYGFEEIVTHELGFEQDVYTPYDEIWGSQESRETLPSHMADLRANRPVRVGTGGSLVYVGRRLSWQQRIDDKFGISDKARHAQEVARVTIDSIHQVGFLVTVKRALKRIFGKK